ncbi:MAG: DUF1579 domain-containing protein [Pirellulaceae bacterium]
MSRLSVLAVLVSLLAASLVRAQEFPKLPAPQKEHEWLKQFVGEWETEAEASMGPEEPAMKCKGTLSARMLGGFWMVCESNGEAMGMQITALLTIGYDPQTNKYVGTWVDSMINHMWKYEGTVDASGKILTLQAEGPNFMQEGKLAKFRDVYEFKSNDQIALSSQMQGEDGKWVTFMNGTATRKK